MEFLGAELALTGINQARHARREVREYATKVIYDETALDDVELLAAEAISNALLHGTPPVYVSVGVEDGCLFVEVRDQGPQVTAAERPDNGRGLEIIAMLAASWTLVGDNTGTCLVFKVNV
jgi:anti-sigma regulatory factor (Ser/Thr protein kinase)